ncbi:MAG: hypothetical protein KAR47_16675 [Planctomycetes bacterium]|nr:hypothetical protein [Planctomycetota bacterium]
MRKLTILWVLHIISALSVAGTINVNWDGSGDYTTIQAAIDAADTNDIVVVADGTYTGSGNYDIDFKGKAITVRSEHGPENCIIDVDEGHRGFYFHSNEDPNTSILDGFTITGAELWETTDTNLPEGYIGGGICIVDSGATIRNCNITDNSSSDRVHYGGKGGGIYLRNSNSRIIDSVISGNVSSCGPYGWPGQGGGIYLEYSQVTIDNCLISNNRAEPCEWEEWFEGGVGGGIYSLSSNLAITNCIIAGNWAYATGGGICASTWSMFDDSRLTVRNCVIVSNYRSSGGGGGISGGYELSLSIHNSILWANGSPLHWGPEEQLDNYDAEVTFSCIQGGWPGLGNTSADPCFVEPGYWEEWPRTYPPKGKWVEGDYHLKSQAGRWLTEATGYWDPNSTPSDPTDDFWVVLPAGSWIGDPVTSPCIDKGNPGCPLGDEPDDITNVRINMGAYGGTSEASRTPPGWGLLADVTNNGVVDGDDLSPQMQDWLQTGTCLPGDLDRSGGVNIFDFALVADDWLKNAVWY